MLLRHLQVSISLTSMGEAFDHITWHINNKPVKSNRDCLDTGMFSVGICLNDFYLSLFAHLVNASAHR